MSRFEFQVKLLLDNYDFFIQPDNPDVKKIAENLANLDLQEMCCRLIDEATIEIKYMTDNVAWGRSEFWQTPGETIMLQSADCADYSFLASSVLQRMNIPHRIVFGFLASEMSESARQAAPYKEIGHAWIELVEDGRWIYALEFTKPYLFILDGQDEDPYYDTWYWPEVYLEWGYL